MAVVRYRDGNGNIVPLRVIKGENGHEMHVRFSAYADGKDMSEVWDDTRDYMGIAFAPTAPTSNADYQWIRVSHFPNGMTLDADNNLHVSGEEITFGETKHKVAKIATGSYTGTGTYGENNRNTLTFDFVPKIVYISTTLRQGASSQLERIVFQWGDCAAEVCAIGSDLEECTFLYYTENADGSATLSFWGSGQMAQMNTGSRTYKYTAIG